jgi:DNA repair protein RadA/Sms
MGWAVSFVRAMEYLGRNDHGGGWQSFFGKHQSLAQTAPVLNLSDIEASDVPRFGTGIDEFDRVLGGGLVPGGVVLIGGDPG